MTDEEIDKMEAGREMDALIAEKVMGYRVTKLDGAPYTEWRNEPSGEQPWKLRSYSTDIAAAWLVVEKMQSQIPGGDIHIECLDGEWEVSTCHGSFAPLGTDGWKDFSSADTAPLAVCRAALKCCRNVADKKEDATEASPGYCPIGKPD